MKRFIWILILLATACAPARSSTDPKQAPVILASTSFLADIAQNVAGDRLHIEALLPVGMDPHAYQASPTDIAKISDSTALVVNGLEYETFLASLLENAGDANMLIEASAGIDPRTSEEGIDPHMWLDPNLVIEYVANIRDGLIRTDPDGAQTYQKNADAYISKLKDLNAWIEGQVSQIPAERRLLVTNHEALGYFADRYGFEVIGNVIPGMSSDSAPSARQMAGLIDAIRSSGAPAIFLGEVENPAIAEQIAQETQVKVVSSLHLESLTEGAPAATYIDMMKHNVSSIVGALK